MTEDQTVFIVDDNPDMRLTLAAFLRAANLKVLEYDSARVFLSAFKPELAGCLVLDIKMPEMSGLELQAALNTAGAVLPVIVVSGEAAVCDAIRAFKQGSFDFIEKPYDPSRLLAKVREALEFDRHGRTQRLHRVEIVERMSTLSEREKRILAMVVQGRQSKVIADSLGVAVSTIDNHRSNIMRKLKADTTADLARLAVLADPDLALK